MNREERLDKLVEEIKNISVSTTRDNANVGNNFSAKLLQSASAANKTIALLETIPEEFAIAHEEGDIHMHDLDSYEIAPNCLSIPTGEMLNRGFNTGYGTINKPKRLESAAELSCILLQSTQNDLFGGQSHQDFDNDLAEYAENTEKEIMIEIMRDFMEVSCLYYMGTPDIRSFSANQQDRILKRTAVKLDKTIHQSMQVIVYNLNSMHSRAGSQVPFSSINLGVPKNKYAAMICEAFLIEYDKGLGKGEQPIFPSIVFRVKEGVNREVNDPYYYLYKLACKVSSKRMNPTFLNLDAPFLLKYYDLEKGIIPSTMG